MRSLSLCLTAVLVVLSAGTAWAQTSVDFEAPGFVDGASVHNLQPDGTPAAPAIDGTNPDVQAWSVRQPGTDEEIVDLTLTDPEHGKVWRQSDLAADGNLQTRPHSPNSGEFHGETGAVDDFGSQTVTADVFYGQVDFRSATGAAQGSPGDEFMMNISAACGDDCRHGFVRIVDDGSGFDLEVIETGDNSGAASCGSFPSTTLDLDLAYDEWHTLGIELTFVDGQATATPGEAGNDVLDVFVDGALVHTGTSWETCYSFVGSGEPRGVDRLVFYRASTGEADADGGLYYDNVLVSELGAPDLPDDPADPDDPDDPADPDDPDRPDVAGDPGPPPVAGDPTSTG